MKCRHCGSELTLPFIDLGTAPPSNAYLTEADLSAPEKWYPLRVLVCTECWLVQTEDYAHRAELFSADYAYFSSFSTTWLQHAERLRAIRGSAFRSRKRFAGCRSRFERWLPSAIRQEYSASLALASSQPPARQWQHATGESK